MEDGAIKGRVREILSGISKAASFQDGDDILEKGIIDSLGTITLLYRLEEEFHIKIAQDDIKKENLNSVNNIVKLVKNKISGA